MKFASTLTALCVLTIAPWCMYQAFVGLRKEIMTMHDLKQCPFCGGKARLFANNGVRVIFSKCNVGTMMLMDSIVYESNAVEMVVETWNRRVDNG